MNADFLACGPYFAPGALESTLAMLLLVKPLAYFAFVKAYRFRVSREIPMTIGQAVKLAALRSVIGIVIIGGGAWAIDWTHYTYSWCYLYVARIAAWWFVGTFGARLVGRRLLGWIIAGMLLNGVFDVGVYLGLNQGPIGLVGAVVVIATLIAVLEISGRRDALRARFSSDPLCTKCLYNLTGNLSGICPECGTPLPTRRVPLCASN